MRILHIANFSWFSAANKRTDNLARYYATDHKITNGLIRNGHSVWNFSYRDSARYLSPLIRSKKPGAKAMNESLIQAAEYFQPHLILLGHCELITADTLAALRDMLPSCKIAQWWVDWFSDRHLPQLRAKQPHLDAFFASTAPSYYAPLIAGKKSPPLFYLPNLVDSGIETFRAFENSEYRYDVFYAASPAAERKTAEQRLSAMQDVRLGLFGFGGNPFLSGTQFTQAVGNSKIGLNISRAVDIPLYSSDRISQLTGNGCLTLTPKTPQMNILFNADEVIYYDNLDDMAEKIKRYLQDDKARRNVAKSGWQRAHNSYNERRITKFIVEAANGENFSEEYEWLPVGFNDIKKS